MIKENVLQVEDYQRLIREAGWEMQPQSAIAAALPRSIVTFSTHIDGQTVGMVRLVGDGHIVFYVQDLVVAKTYRRRGIATALMKTVMIYLEKHASHHSFIGLMSAASLEAFYQQFGFMQGPTVGYGAGMTQVWQKATKE